MLLKHLNKKMGQDCCHLLRISRKANRSKLCLFVTISKNRNITRILPTITCIPSLLQTPLLQSTTHKEGNLCNFSLLCSLIRRKLINLLSQIVWTLRLYYLSVKTCCTWKKLFERVFSCYDDRMIKMQREYLRTWFQWNLMSNMSFWSIEDSLPCKYTPLDLHTLMRVFV